MFTKLTLMNAFTIAFILSVFEKTAAQNTSPYWSLAGNSNSTLANKIGTTGNVSLRFVTNNLERMKITLSGNVGIGSTSPIGKLHVNSPVGGTPFIARINEVTKLCVHSGGGVSIGTGGTPPTNGLYVLGNTGIGTNNPSYKLHVVGNTSITGNTGLHGGINILYALNVNAGTLNGINVTDPGNGYILTGSVSGTGVAMLLSSALSTNNAACLYSTHYGHGQAIAGQNFNDGTGVFGTSTNYIGVYGGSENFVGVWGHTDDVVNGWGGYFEGDVYTTGNYFSPSDENLKQNIQDVEDGMSIINNLKPKNYEFKHDTKYAALKLPKGTHYGFIAQNIKEVLPGLVKETKFQPRNFQPGGNQQSQSTEQSPAEATYIQGMNYVELIPILVKALQEQQVEIDYLRREMRKLTGKGNSITHVLDQNYPNPVTSMTAIHYYLPADTRNAKITLTNMKGEVLKEIMIRTTGDGIVNITKGTLPAGAYNYSLWLDGKKVETKQLVIAR